MVLATAFICLDCKSLCLLFLLIPMGKVPTEMSLQGLHPTPKAAVGKNLQILNLRKKQRKKTSLAPLPPTR